jgi:hypothetical protein
MDSNPRKRQRCIPKISWLVFVELVVSWTESLQRNALSKIALPIAENGNGANICIRNAKYACPILSALRCDVWMLKMVQGFCPSGAKTMGEEEWHRRRFLCHKAPSLAVLDTILLSVLEWKDILASSDEDVLALDVLISVDDVVSLGSGEVEPSAALLINVASIEGIADDWSAPPGRVIGPSVHAHSISRRRLRRPATGVSGQVSLSSSEEESRFSPALGEWGLTRDLPIRCDSLRVVSGGGGGKATADSDSDNDEEVAEPHVEDRSEDSDVEDLKIVGAAGSAPVCEESLEESGDSMSECAQVYFVVLISSARGFRKHTRFSMGNIGRL